MKKIFLSSLAFFAFFLASCQDDRMFEDAPTLPGQQTAKIYVDSDGESSDSRITHDYASNEHYWQEKDSLSVFMRDGKNRLFQLAEGAGTQSGGFIGLIWGGTAGDPSSANFPNNVAYYPYNKDLKATYSGGVYSLTSVLASKQTFGGDGTFAQYAFPMIGVTEDNTRINYQLKAVTSAAILHLRSNSDKKISKIVLKANGRKIAGQFTTKTAYNESPVTVATEEAVDYVALECNPPVQLNSETAVKFWFTVLPTVYEAGDLTVDIYDSEGGYCKGLNISPYGSNTHELKRNIRKNFGRDEGKYIYYTPQGNLKTEFLNAVKNAQSGETVQYQLQSNLILDEEVDIKKGVTVDLDLNGYTITSNISKKTGYKKGNYCWYIYQGTGKSDKGGVLKIKNGTLETPVEETANSLGYQLIHCDQWAKLELENVTIEHNQVDGEGSGTAICIWNNSNLTARNTNVTSKNYCLYSSHTSTDPTVENIIDGGTYISQESHVIYGNPAARVTIYDGNFKTLNNNKQCVYITMAYYKSMITIKGGKFGDNKYSHVGWTGSNDPEYPFAPAVASKSVDTFEELLAAIDEAKNGASMGITITADIEGNGKSIIIPENANIAFNLNGKTLKNSVKGAAAIINNGSATFSNGTILNGNGEAQESSVFANTGTLILDKMTVGSSTNRGAAVVNNGGVVAVIGGTYNNIESSSNGFAYVFVNNGGTMNISDATSVGNPQGIFYASAGTINVDGGTYTINGEGNTWYVAYAEGEGIINLNTGTYTWNAAGSNTEATKGNVNVGLEAEINWTDGVKDEDSNEIVISSTRGMAWFYEQLIGGETFTNKTVKIGRDIDMTGFTWDSHSANSRTNFKGVLDGNNFTLNNLTLTASAAGGYATMFELFSGEVKNLTIDGITATDMDVAGRASAIAGAMSAGKLSNVTIKNLVATGCQKVSGLVSNITNGDVIIENCRVENATLKANDDKLYQAGAIIGYASGFNTLAVTGCSIENIKIEKAATEADCQGKPFYCHPFIGAIHQGTTVTKNGIATLNNNIISGNNTTTDICSDCSTAYYAYGKHETDAKKLIINIDNEQVWPVLVAKVNGQGYETLAEAIESISGNEATTVKLMAGTYSMPEVKGKTITFEPVTGGQLVKINVATAGHIDSKYEGSILNFNNITLVGTEYTTNTQGYQKAVAENYTNCTFENYYMFAADDVTVTDCIFNGIEGQYFWTGSASNITFTDCEFNGVDRALKVLSVGNKQDETRNVIFNNCEFNATKSNKAVLELDSQNAALTSPYRVEVNNCTKSDVFSGWFNDSTNGDQYLIIIDGNYHAYNTASFTKALKNIASGTIVLTAGEFDLPSNLNMTNNTPAKNLTIKGVSNETILNGAQNSNANSPGNYAHNVTLKIENVKYVTANNGYNGGFGHAASVEFLNSTIEGQYYAHSGAYHKFTGCTINPLNGYLYTYASDCDFEDCTFEASEGKALQIYEDASQGENIVNITNCTFIAAKQAATWDGKPVTGIDINSNGTTKFVVNITNSTSTGFPTGLNSNSNLWNVKNVNGDITVTLNGNNVWSVNGLSIAEGVGYKNNVYNISSKAGLTWFNSQLTNGEAFAEKTIKLVSDIDLSGENWTPMGGTAARTNPFSGVFDGNYKHITGLTVNNSQCGGFFGSLSKGIVKNLTIVEPNIQSYHYAGAIAGHCEANAGNWTIENCKVEGGNIVLITEVINGKHDNGDKVGGIVGYAWKGTINNCTVDGTSIAAYRDMGGIVGSIDATIVTNNLVKDATITVNQDVDYVEEKATNANAIIGRTVNKGTESGNTNQNVKFITNTKQVGDMDTPVNGGDL